MKKILVGALAALFLIGCGGGNSPEAKIEYGKAKGNAKDFPQKLEAAVDFCDDGLPEACLDAVEILGGGPATLKDPKKAYKYLHKGCDAGSSMACTVIGGVYLMPIEKRKNDVRAKLIEGMDIPFDPKEAISYLKKACDLEPNETNCDIIIKVYTGDDTVSDLLGKDLAQSLVDMDEGVKYAIKVYEKSKGGCKEECNKDIADFYIKKAKDAKKAAPYALKACEESNDGYVCGRLSKQIEELGDTDTAKTLATNGCNKGDRTSCKLFEEKYKN